MATIYFFSPFPGLILKASKVQRWVKCLLIKNGKNLGLLIREAIDSFITKYSRKRSNDTIDKVAGLWSDRDETLSLESLRNSLDRGFE